MTDDTRLAAALETFAAQIERALQNEGPEAVGRPIAAKQDLYVVANHLMANFLESVGQPKAAALFRDQGLALQEVAEGRSPPLYKVEKEDVHAPAKRGRRDDPSQTWHARALLCIGIEFLKAGGLGQDEAMALAVRNHRIELSNLLRPKATLATSLRGWLKQFAADDVDDVDALSGYKDGMKNLEQVWARRDDVRVEGRKIIAAAAAHAAKLLKI